jgi:phage tail sheath protein FI
MPVTPTYPGVYIQEIPSGVRTIAGVATAITAFVGRTPLGPVEQPTDCFSFGEFVRRFGGLAAEFPLTYAVRDFFANGGSHALIVRLFRPGADEGRATVTVGGSLNLIAASPGAWGNALRATVAFAGATPADIDALTAIAAPLGLTPADFFDLSLRDDARGTTEVFRNVSVAATAGARRVDRVLAASSGLMAVNGALPGARPAEQADAAATGGDDGQRLDALTYQGDLDAKTGMRALEKADLFNLLCIPPDSRAPDAAEEAIFGQVWGSAATYCVDRRAFLIVDPPASWSANPANAVSTARDAVRNSPLVSGTDARNAALFFPRLVMRDPLRDNQLEPFAPSGAVAGVFARTDAARGVWKAPAGIDAAIGGVERLEIPLTDDENGILNPLAVNCLRAFPGVGRVVWGARTMRGSDQLGDEYKYVPVRRLALFLEESLYRGTQWVVFEPNDEPLWAQIRLNITAFMQGLFRQGAFQGTSPRDAYFVKCDRETTTQDDMDRGIVNIVVGFAPLRPAEFVIISIQQIRNTD